MSKKDKRKTEKKNKDFLLYCIVKPGMLRASRVAILSTFLAKPSLWSVEPRPHLSGLFGYQITFKFNPLS